MNLHERIENYWTLSAERFSEGIRKELASPTKDAWMEIIRENAPAGSGLRALDIGTGPGFFVLLLSALGHQVTAIDCSNGMLEEAKTNMAKAGFRGDFFNMNGQQLDFSDAYFDLIVCRNLVWTLQDPAGAYREWRRVLKPGGRLLVFDANWHLHLFDQEMRKQHEANRKRARELGIPDPADKADMNESNDIARKLFLSDKMRPQWDAAALLNCGFDKIVVARDITDRVWSPEQKILYRSTPLFMARAEKS
jgi:SAM-dependent methyltransferase